MLASPILLCSILVILRLNIDPTPRFHIVWDPINLGRSWDDMTTSIDSRSNLASHLKMDYSVFVPQMVIAWAPHNYNIFKNIIELASNDLRPMMFEGFDDCDAVQYALLNDFYFAGICFDNSNVEKAYNIKMNHLVEDEGIIPYFNYTIVVPSELRIIKEQWIGDNWQTIYNDDPRMSIVRRLHVQTNDGQNSYIREGIINIQKAITENYLKTVSKKKNLPKILLRRFPVDFRSEDPLMMYLSRALPLLLVVGFMFPSQILVWVSYTTLQLIVG